MTSEYDPASVTVTGRCGILLRGRAGEAAGVMADHWTAGDEVHTRRRAELPPVRTCP